MQLSEEDQERLARLVDWHGVPASIVIRRLLKKADERRCAASAQLRERLNELARRPARLAT